MKKLLIFTALIIFSLSATVYAATYEQLYDCSGSDDTILGIVPGKIGNENDCKGLENYKSSYTACIQEIRETNRKILALYNQGKCKKSNMKISETFKNSKCSFSYNASKKEVVGYAFSGNSKDKDACLVLLAKEIKKKYPNITTDNSDFVKYGFTYKESRY